ncbi:MAG TPA: hypothetical protein VF046_09840 [Gemmatimonadales bacterium]
MTPRTHALAVVVALGLVPAAVRAESAPGVEADTAALEFHGFRAGASVAELQRLVRERPRGALRCKQAQADARVSECRGTLDDPALGGRVDLWVSCVNGVASVITISAAVEADRLDRWRDAVERRYGRVDASVQGTQWMMQWVRRGRMLRLTWRTERGGRMASVSLVDGRVLDDWGRTRS